MARKILIIDDEPGLVDLVKGWLGSKGYEVMSAGGGEEGLAAAKEFDPALIILDINMPGVNGYEVLSRLRAEAATRFTPVIMLTQKRETESLLKARDLGTTDYMMKPFSVEELLRIVRRYDWFKE